MISSKRLSQPKTWLGLLISLCGVLAIPILFVDCASMDDQTHPYEGKLPRTEAPRKVIPSPRIDSAPQSDQASPAQERIDLIGLKRSLGLEGEQLGYAERLFNTCDVGYGYASAQNCRARALVVIRVQLQCRESNGSENSTNYQTEPLGATDLIWTLAGQKGGARTDGDGRVEIAMIAASSPREQRLRIVRSNDFFAVTAEDARRVVAPNAWCKD